MLARALFLIFSALSAVSPDLAETVEAAVVGDHYIHVDAEGRVSLWQEANGIPGLQIAPSPPGAFNRGHSADTRVLA